MLLYDHEHIAGWSAARRPLRSVLFLLWHHGNGQRYPSFESSLQQNGGIVGDVELLKKVWACFSPVALSLDCTQPCKV